MNNRSFEQITEFVKSLPFPKDNYLTESFLCFGKTIGEDELAKSFEKIILNRIQTPQKKSSLNSQGEISLFNSRKLTDCLDIKKKFSLFTLLVNHYYNTQSNDICPGYATRLKLIGEILDINKKDYNTVINFYKSELPFQDKNESIYFTGKNTSRLVGSKGVNVEFTLKKEGEIIYMKYLKGFDLFLSKTFYTHRPTNSITEQTRVKEINIVTEGNFFQLGLEKYNFKICKNLIAKFIPFHSVKVNATDITPEIILDSENSQIIISGHSTPMSPTNYFEPIYEWLDNYKQYGKEHLELHLKLDYYNTYTSKFILKLISLCKKLGDLGKNVKVHWYYMPGDDEIIELGEHLQFIFKQKFVFLALKDADKIEV